MKFSVARDGDRVTYTTNPQGDAALATVIVADKTGVHVTSTWGPIRRGMDVEDFILTVRKAWAHHEFLLRNMVHGAVLDEAMAQNIAVQRADYANKQLLARSAAPHPVRAIEGAR
jgi:hypothetical protein